jgi:hypothetical protein
VRSEPKESKYAIYGREFEKVSGKVYLGSKKT